MLLIMCQHPLLNIIFFYNSKEYVDQKWMLNNFHHFDQMAIKPALY